MANVIYSTIMIVGEKEYLDSFKVAIDVCAEKHMQECGEDEAWALDVLEYMHINTKTLSVNTTRKVNSVKTWWFNPHFDERGKHLVIEEACLWERSDLLDFLVQKSDGLLTAYTILESRL